MFSFICTASLAITKAKQSSEGIFRDSWYSQTVRVVSASLVYQCLIINVNQSMNAKRLDVKHNLLEERQRVRQDKLKECVGIQEKWLICFVSLKRCSDIRKWSRREHGRRDSPIPRFSLILMLRVVIATSAARNTQLNLC